MYGWYYDEDFDIEGKSEDLWALIDQAVVEAESEGALMDVRVGPLSPMRVSDLIDIGDVRDHVRGLLFDLIHDAATDRVVNADVFVDEEDSPKVWEALMAWAEETFNVPIRYVGGKWEYGPVPVERFVEESLTGATWALITFDERDGVSGPRWIWSCGAASSGRSPTLLEAMWACERLMAGDGKEKES